MRRRVAASLRRRRTVRYFFIFVVLHASFSFGVWPIESRSGCDGVTLFMRPFLVTLRGSCEVPKKTDFFPQDLSFFFLQLTRWRGPGQTWRVRGNIFVAQIRSETPPDMFLILPLLCSATDTPIFCTSVWPDKNIFVEACNATNGRDLIKRNGYIFYLA